MTSKQIKRLLETPFWLETLTVDKAYTRTHDDCDGDPNQSVTVSFHRAVGDVWLTVMGRHGAGTLRFRDWGGGGSSLRTRQALVILAEAIRLDNEERPQTGGNET